ncbi:SDR family NAD(P)-dependent oxidoreductase [Ktedonobacter racemifer]|uniref:Short-chain dehydrogenase/reductase SDR n=1 Tax=Ktedonobacter racemifer DSM 44963 TaxID=485913 RepID=D6U8N5_KTERA|nr:SDR family oxidoreductase [Ktedonobacter racemifer]EFH79595.1 short-chain dehydrogenase/reductase SDR [Ktedonobacter racemifer DSM 44963]
MSDDNSLVGKVFLITGASRGIGAAIARQALEAGAKVVLTARESSTQLLHEVASFTHERVGQALVLAGDINDDNFQHQLVKTAIERFGRIDVFVSNAGVVHFADLQHTTEEVLDYHLKTNFYSAVSLTQRIVPHIHSGGSIIYITTSITNGGFPMLAAYAASKGALKCFMQCMAVELAPQGIAVNAVAPGPTQTEMWPRALPKDALEHMGGKILPRLLTGEFGDPQLVASTVLHMAKTPTIRGQEILIDSGYTIS